MVERVPAFWLIGWGTIAEGLDGGANPWGVALKVRRAPLLIEVQDHGMVLHPVHT